MKADVLWMVGVVVLHFSGQFALGSVIPADAVYLDWGMFAVWFAALGALDLAAVSLLLGVRQATWLAVTLYVSCAWSMALCLSATLSTDALIQIDRQVQFVITTAIVAALAWGVFGCRSQKQRSSSLLL